MIAAVACGDHETVDRADRAVVVLKNGNAEGIAELFRSRGINAVNADTFDV